MMINGCRPLVVVVNSRQVIQYASALLCQAGEVGLVKAGLISL